jgi:hypothetical protein
MSLLLNMRYSLVGSFILAIGGSSFILAILFLIVFGIFGYEAKYVDRKQLHSEIELAVRNNADLQDVKQIFEDRQYSKKTLVLGVPKEKEDKRIYREPISLSRVLRDIRADIYLKQEVDGELASKMKTMISAYEKSDPFDKLEKNQRLHFETIQSKLGNNYASIQNDINLIVDELANKNVVVEKYLGDATTLPVLGFQYLLW